MEIVRYCKATLGGFLGGVIFSLPWVLLVIFSPINFPLLSFLIAPGVNKGYRFMKGRVNRELPKFIIGISVFILLIIYFVVFPCYYDSLIAIFRASYWKMVLRNTIISLVCAIVGIYKTVEDILYEIGLRY